jgi:citrate lyase beta subunit
VPADNPHRVGKALASSADAVILDLEDGVAPARKDEARELVRTILAEPRSDAPTLIVRINPGGTEFYAEDLAAVATGKPDAVMVPKAEPAAVADLPERIPPVVALIETAAGLVGARQIAADPRVERLALGSFDLALELRLEPRADGQELLFARSSLVLESALAGAPPPIDGVFIDFRDDEGLRKEALLVRSLGFGAKTCIHPAQLEIVNEAFSPSAEELSRAHEVVDAFERAAETGAGVTAHEGVMIDRPVVERARQLLARARHAG